MMHGLFAFIENAVTRVRCMNIDALGRHMGRQASARG